MSGSNRSSRTAARTRRTWLRTMLMSCRRPRVDRDALISWGVDFGRMAAGTRQGRRETRKEAGARARQGGRPDER